MSEDLKMITTSLIELGVLPKSLKTSQAVSFLDSPKFHRKKLYKLRDELSGKRVGAGRNLAFDTKKIIELKLKNQ